jgi:hypothetical protein
MKNVLILLAVVLVAAGAYWKFRDKIHGKIEEVKDETKGAGADSVLPAIKQAVSSSPAQPKVQEKLALATSEFIRGLPNSMANPATEGGANRDVVLEVVAGSGTAGLPAQLRLTPNVWLDTSTIQFPAGLKPGATMLIHLQSIGAAGGNVAGSEHIVQCTAEPLPQPMEAGIRRENWRAIMAVSGPPSTSAVLTELWVTEFLRRVENNPQRVIYLVEGTFDSYQRAAKNAPHDTVTLEEAKNVKFHFAKNTQASSKAEEAEKMKKQGNRITLKIKLDSATTPKFVAQDFDWCIPVKDQFDYWNQQYGVKGKFHESLALAAWAETRNLGEQAESLYQKAHGEVTREAAIALGVPAQAIRIHLADEVHDQWFYEGGAGIRASNHRPVWRQAPAKYSHDIAAAPKRPCAIVQSKPDGSSVGDYYLLEE